MMNDRGSGHRSAGLLLGGGLALAGLWLWNRHRALRAQHRHPPAGRFMTVDGVRLHYVDRGEGRPVILLHGAGSLVQDFDLSILGPLAARHRVVAFDRPGHGYSDRPAGRRWTPEAQADLIRRAAARLGLRRPLVVGHSWGCLVALAFALRHPGATAGVVLLSGYYYPKLRPDAAPFQAPAVPLVGPLIGHTVMPPLGRMTARSVIRRTFAPSPVPRSFDAFPVGLSLRPSQLRADAEDLVFLRSAAGRLSAGYRDLAVPVSIVAGSGDRIVAPAGHALRLFYEAPRARLRLFHRTGHMVHHSRPGAVVRLIEEAAAWAAEGDPS